MTRNYIIISKNDELYKLLSQQNILPKIKLHHFSKYSEIKDLEHEIIIFDNVKPPKKTGKYLEIGENGNFSKPYKLSKLIDEIIRITDKTKTENIIKLGKYKFDLIAKKITYRKKEITLTDKEVAIIQKLYFAKSAVSVKELLNSIWNLKEDIDTHTLPTHIYRLRQKLGDIDIIKTEENGYSLKLEEKP